MTIKEYNLCVNEHSDKVYLFILRSMRDTNRAQDVVQDAFEKLWLKIDTVESNKAKSYLFTIAYNKMIDIFRKENRSSYLENSQLESDSEDHAYSDIKDVLDEALNNLPEIQRSVVMLRDYEGYNYKEIGEITGLNEGQVKVYIFRARKNLKNYLVDINYII